MSRILASFLLIGFGIAMWLRPRHAADHPYDRYQAEVVVRICAFLTILAGLILLLRELIG